MPSDTEMSSFLFHQVIHLLYEYLGFCARLTNVGEPSSGRVLFTVAALFPLHMASPLPFKLGYQLCQFDQILRAEVGATRSDCHEGILSSGIGVTGQNRAQPALLVEEANAIFTPVVAVINQFELAAEPGMEWMGYPETQLCRVSTGCC